jgi:hypothetical protein
MRLDESTCESSFLPRTIATYNNNDIMVAKGSRGHSIGIRMTLAEKLATFTDRRRVELHLKRINRLKPADIGGSRLLLRNLTSKLHFACRTPRCNCMIGRPNVLALADEVIE